jgi:hypothetical protein
MHNFHDTMFSGRQKKQPFEHEVTVHQGAQGKESTSQSTNQAQKRE